MDQAGKQNRISNNTLWLMFGVALFFDTLQFFFALILIGFILNWGISIIAFLTFFFWFNMKDVALADTLKKIAIQVANWFFEFIPLGNGFYPGITISVGLTILFTKADDALANRGIVTGLTGNKEKIKQQIAERQQVLAERRLQAETEERVVALSLTEVQDEIKQPSSEETPALRREIPLVSGKDFLSKTAPPRVTKSIPTNTQGNTGIIGRIREQVLTREP